MTSKQPPRRHNTRPESPHAKRAVTGAAPEESATPAPKTPSARPKRGSPIRRTEVEETPPDPGDEEKPPAGLSADARRK
jgi:hypothetical protein